MNLHRREFLHAAGATALLAATDAAALVAGGVQPATQKRGLSSEPMSPYAAIQRYPGANWCRGIHRTLRGPVAAVVRNYAQEPALLPHA